MTDRMIIKCNALAKTIDTLCRVIAAYGWSGTFEEERKLDHILESVKNHLSDCISKEYTIVTLMLLAEKARDLDAGLINVLDSEALEVIEEIRRVAKH